MERLWAPKRWLAGRIATVNLLPPEIFIKVAEDHGFVGSITKFVLRRALKEFGEVFKKMPDFRLNVNVAAADLVDPEFLPMLDKAVSEAKIKPKSLVLEVTESTTASREDAMESIRALRDRGYSIYIDDFGTGYSNLSICSIWLSAPSRSTRPSRGRLEPSR